MQFYYLDGIEKKEPFEKSEVKLLNLSSDTLVFHEGMTTWMPYKLVQELHEIDSTTLPSEKAKRVLIPATVILIIGIITSIGLAYVYTLNRKEADLRDIEAKINDILIGKDEVCDYDYKGISGSLKQVDYVILDNEKKPIVEYFQPETNGWKVLTLVKKSNGYEIVESSSLDMGFKVPESRYTAGTDFGYGFKTEGFNTPTHRGTVQNAYKVAVEYITKDKENNSYVPGSFGKIKTFGELRTKYHTIENVDPSIPSEGSTNLKSWNNTLGSVFNTDWIVWYQSAGRHYEIVENKEQLRISWLISSLVASTMIICLYLILKFRKKVIIG